MCPFVRCRIHVHLAPALTDEETHLFLRQLRVEWPLAKGTCPDLEHLCAIKETLRQCRQAEPAPMHPDGVLFKLHLKKFLEEKQWPVGAEAYDPKLDIFLGRQLILLPSYVV